MFEFDIVTDEVLEQQKKEAGAIPAPKLPGNYLALIVSCEHGFSKKKGSDGKPLASGELDETKPMIVAQVRLFDKKETPPEWEGHLMFCYFSLSTSYGKVDAQSFFKACGFPPGKADISTSVGRIVIAKLEADKKDPASLRATEWRKLDPDTAKVLAVRYPANALGQGLGFPANIGGAASKKTVETSAPTPKIDKDDDIPF